MRLHHFLTHLTIIALCTGCLSESSTTCEDPEECTATASDRRRYPGFGTEVGSIIAPLEFVSTEGQALSLSAVYADPKNRVLLLTTSAGWCTACIEEQAALETLYQDYAGQGVEILVTVFEKGDYSPADSSFANQWQRRYGLSYLVVADPPFKMRDYYPGGDASVTPILLVIDVNSMTIIERFVGFDDFLVRSLIDNMLNGG